MMWHYEENGTSRGPVSEGDLIGMIHAGSLHGGTLVWQEGMAGWTPASQTSLATFLPAAAPPPVSAPALVPGYPQANPYAPPAAIHLASPAYYQKAVPLTWKQILFSFQGRIPRRQYWAGSLVPLVLMLVLLGPAVLVSESSGTPGSEMGIFSMILLNAALVLTVWISLAVSVKRWHDRGKSGAWVLIVLIPFGSIWAFIECGCLRGTVGPNQFGGDPT